MAFTKGQSGNPGGRPVGSKSKIPSDMREWRTGVIADNREQFVRDLKDIDPEKRLAMLEKLLPYVLPKLRDFDDAWDTYHSLEWGEK
jgi:hypothetical protein